MKASQKETKKLIWDQMRIPSPAGSPCKNIGLFFKRIPHQKTGDGRERRGTE